ncbi:hypothetical protein O181_000865 [Austropuccinia psidii MF-1]|uniref:Translation initiation factor 3 N-terminal domain-containing protein n=1 Tax=Austropuccinia psidii MF-1 TaxID=1389203 RepID=A0A9Q3B9M8_9BASI|nr:hypothetical protein [Austropuccinia psidii MF-1]
MILKIAQAWKFERAEAVSICTQIQHYYSDEAPSKITNEVLQMYHLMPNSDLWVTVLRSSNQTWPGLLYSNRKLCRCDRFRRYQYHPKRILPFSSTSSVSLSVAITTFDSLKRASRSKAACDHQIKSQWIQLVNPSSTLKSQVTENDASAPSNSLIQPSLTREVLARLDLNKYTLVEVNPNADPPICKIISKELISEKERTKLKQKKAQQKMNRHENVIKEIHLTWMINSNDLSHKLKVVQQSFEKGYKVRVIITSAHRYQEVEHQHKTELLNELDERLTSFGGQKTKEEMEGRKLMIEWHPVEKK